MNTRDQDVLCSISSQGIATLTLNRIDKHNAFDDVMIAQLLARLNELQADPAVRVLVLQANGRHFSAGADLQWMRAMAAQSRCDNHRDAARLARLMQTLDTFPHPTLVAVQGSAFGGALGLICCGDIVVATTDARFCLSEVRLGLIPATIGPYLCRAIGQRQSRRYMLTAETIDAFRAMELGLVHQVVDEQPTALAEIIEHFCHTLLSHSPAALTAAKALCQRCYATPIDSALITHTSQLIAELRVSDQGQEGLNAFLAKRPPQWPTPAVEKHGGKS